MKKTFLAFALAGAFSLNLFASEAGGAGPGGGDANSAENAERIKNYNDRFNNLKRVFSGVIQERLSIFADMHKFEHIESSAVSSLIAQLANQGLVEEILNSKYSFQKNCYEKVSNQNGNSILVEKDASTDRGVRGSIICLSLSRLMSKDRIIKFTDLIGLAMHENVRHFLTADQQDTETYTLSGTGEQISYHPTALYTSENFSSGSFGHVYTGGILKITDDLYVSRVERASSSSRNLRFFTTSTNKYKFIHTYSTNTNCKNPKNSSKNILPPKVDLHGDYYFYFGNKCEIEIAVLDLVNNKKIFLPDNIKNELLTQNVNTPTAIYNYNLNLTDISNF